MFLGIEIGGTKLQLGVGEGDGGAAAAMERRAIDPQRGAQGILEQIAELAPPLIRAHHVQAIGIGFGGPVDAAAGIVMKSHQVAGWEHFRLTDWCLERFGLAAYLENDCDAAGLAEARFGAGRGAKVVLYVTVGSGIGGGLVTEGEIFRGQGRGAAEIGHLRPGVQAVWPDQTVESIASGWGIAAAVQTRLADATSIAADAIDLLKRCGRVPARLTTEIIVRAAGDGNLLAAEALAQATQVLGWAIAQAITLVGADAVVLGGGVSHAPAELFLEPVRRAAAQYVFPPFAESYRIVPATLGESVVVHGALATAARRHAAAGG